MHEISIEQISKVIHKVRCKERKPAQMRSLNHSSSCIYMTNKDVLLTRLVMRASKPNATPKCC